MKIIVALLTGAFLFLPLAASAQEAEQEYLEKARVLNATPSEEIVIDGTEVGAERQTVTVEMLSGPEAGTVATFENDFTQVETGDVVYVRHLTGGFGPEMWSIADPYRLDVLIIIGVIFLALVCVFGGIQGLRGLASLAGSIVLIFTLLIPPIYDGYSPILVSIGVASLIIVLGSYVTHGFTRTTTAAMLGMIATIVVTGLATYLAIHAAGLSGFTSEHNVYLNFGTDGRIDMLGLLFGGIMIGLLGVLYDSAIGQAVAVEELFVAGQSYTRAQVYKRAIRIGREHIGALVNTLAIAYVGASLPILLLFMQSTASVGYILNSELFATEIIRILMGSIGLVLAVPITTLIASYMLQHARESSGTHRH